MKRFLKVITLVFLIALTLVFTVAGIVLLAPSNLELDEKLLINTSDFINFYDIHNFLLSGKRDNLDIDEDIPKSVKNAFVASEDKNFYSHHGIDYLRVIKAAFVNLKNGDFSQGASTISQQLIKNTHLSQEKTLSRKYKELKLAQKLEKTYSKNQILNMYLNTIYFGRNRYGIKDAADYYYSKDISELDLNECATLAGIIPSPAKFNPIDDPIKAKQKRNVVLKRMLDNGFITEEEYVTTLDKDLELNVHDENDIFTPYLNAALDEIYESTNLSPYDLSRANVYTFYESDIQLLNVDAKTENDLDYQAVVIDNSSHAVLSYYSTCGQIARSPASAIKPLLVYAPALEEGLVYEMTKISDESVTIDGFTPKNYKDKYYGDVSVKFALANSLNVPTVKLYNSLGAEKSKKYIEMLGINDTNAALNAALGQFNEGVTVKELASAYTVFPNYGRYAKAAFVDKITDKFGNVLYERDKSNKAVFGEGTATLINDALKSCVKEGTAKKLSGKVYDVCAKTGTYGNEDGNVDAYVCAYTSEHTVVCWSGYADSSLMPNSVTGGSTPCVSADHILNGLYSEKTPANLSEKGIERLKIDKKLYDEKGEFALARENTKDKNVYEFLFDERYRPENKANLSAPTTEIKTNITDNRVSLVCPDDDLLVIVQKQTPFGLVTFFDGSAKDFIDVIDKDETYYVTPYALDGKDKICGQTTAKTVKAQKKKSEYYPDEWWKDE